MTVSFGSAAVAARGCNQLIDGRSNNDAAQGDAQHNKYDDLHLSSFTSAPQLGYEQIEAIE